MLTKLVLPVLPVIFLLGALFIVVDGSIVERTPLGCPIASMASCTAIATPSRLVV